MNLSRGNQVRCIGVEDEEEDDEEYVECDTADNSCFIDNLPTPIQRRVTTRKSPYLKCFYNTHPVSVCLDSGAESSMISNRFAENVGITVRPATQGALQADASSPLEIVGEMLF